MGASETAVSGGQRLARCGDGILQNMRVSIGVAQDGLLDIPVHKASQIDLVQAVFSLQVLPEIISPRPVFGFIFTLIQIAAIDWLVFCGYLVNGLQMSIKVILGSKSLVHFCTS